MYDISALYDFLAVIFVCPPFPRSLFFLLLVGIQTASTTFNMSAVHLVLTVVLLPITGIWSTLPDYPLSSRELSTRAGYYTDGGKYLGGIPKYDKKLEVYECTEFNSDNSSSSSNATDSAAPDNSVVNGTTTDGAEGNATVCTSWTANEVGSDECAVGRCFCQSIASNGEYCDAWTCSQLEVDSDITWSGYDNNDGCIFEKEVTSVIRQENTHFLSTWFSDCRRILRLREAALTGETIFFSMTEFFNQKSSVLNYVVCHTFRCIPTLVKAVGFFS